MNNIKINLINLESTDCVIFDNIKFNNCSYLQLLIDDIDIRLFDEFDDFLIVYSELYASTQNSGKFLIFTCACGVADDGGWDYVNVTHKESSIEWRFFFQKNTLGQALIKVSNIMTTNPVRNNKELRIDISSKKSIYDIDSGFILKTDGLERDLETLFKNDHPNLSRRYFTLYFLDVASTDLNGYSRINKHYGVMFNTHTEETITHECLHGLTLPHSFSYTEWTNYVYEAMATDNIMDYSHLEKDPVSGNARSPINRFQLWKWQWETIRKTLFIKINFL